MESQANQISAPKFKSDRMSCITTVQFVVIRNNAIEIHHEQFQPLKPRDKKAFTPYKHRDGAKTRHIVNPHAL